MKILTVIESLGNGGAERALINTLPYLQKTGIENEVAILFKEDTLAAELEEKGIRVHRMNLSNRWNVFEASKKLNILVKANKYDILHAHLFFAHFYVGLLSAFNRTFKTVVTFHNLGYQADPANTWVKKIRKKIDIWNIKCHYHKATAVSTAVKEHYGKHLATSDIQLIYNSFPAKNIITSANENLACLEKYREKYRLIAITPGRLVKEKGHRFLLEAVELLNEKHTDVCYLIAGDGPLKEKITEETKTRNLKNVFLLGFVEHSQLLGLVKSCDLIISSSVSEGFPMVIGEAMILKKAIVATNVGGIPDFIDDHVTGLLAESGNSIRLAQKISLLIEDESMRQKLAHNATIKAQKFDIENIAEEWKHLYESL